MALTKEEKSKQIKKALSHRARLRRNYFKALEEEGEQVPVKPERPALVAKPETHVEKKEVVKNRKKLKRQEIYEAKKKAEADKTEKLKARKRHYSQMTSYTSKGQPKMGARVTRLLEKIKENSN